MQNILRQAFSAALALAAFQVLSACGVSVAEPTENAHEKLEHRESGLRNTTARSWKSFLFSQVKTHGTLVSRTTYRGGYEEVTKMSIDALSWIGADRLPERGSRLRLDGLGTEFEVLAMQTSPVIHKGVRVATILTFSARVVSGSHSVELFQPKHGIGVATQTVNLIKPNDVFDFRFPIIHSTMPTVMFSYSFSQWEDCNEFGCEAKESNFYDYRLNAKLGEFPKVLAEVIGSSLNITGKKRGSTRAVTLHLSSRTEMYASSFLSFDLGDYINVRPVSPSPAALNSAAHYGDKGRTRFNDTLQIYR